MRSDLFSMCGWDILAVLDYIPAGDAPEEYLVEDELFDDLIQGSSFNYTQVC